MQLKTPNGIRVLSPQQDSQHHLYPSAVCLHWEWPREAAPCPTRPSLNRNKLSVYDKGPVPGSVNTRYIPL